MPRNPFALKRPFPLPLHVARPIAACLGLSAGLALTGCQVDDAVTASKEPGLAVSALIGVPNPVPGRIQAEDYKVGNEGSAYHDNDANNRGGDYRSDGVDINVTNDGGAGFYVGWTESGEWMDYALNVASAGAYKLTLRAASGRTGTKNLTVLVDGIARGTFTTSDATGWSSYKNIVLNGIGLPAGAHTLRLYSNTGGLDLNYLDAAQTSTANQAPRAVIAGQAGKLVGEQVTLDGSGSYDPDVRPSALTYAWTQVAGPTVTLTGATTAKPKFTPTVRGTYRFRLTVSDGALTNSTEDETDFWGTAIGASSRLQAEDYGHVYETTGANQGGGTCRNDSVDVETTTDVGGGCNVGYIVAGEWLEYEVRVATAGSYTLTARMASGQAGIKTMALSIDGGTAIPFSFTDASGWQSWRDVVVSGVNLTAGEHDIRLSMLTGGFNLNYVDFHLGGPNLIVNGDFSNALASWITAADAPAAATFANEAGSARVNITNAGANPYDIELAQHVSLIAGRTYRLEFDVKAQATPKEFRIAVEHNVDPWTPYVNQPMTVTAAANTYQHYVVTWTQSATDAAAQVVFQFGAQNTQDVWVDNVTLR